MKYECGCKVIRKETKTSNETFMYTCKKHTATELLKRYYAIRN